MVKGLNPELFIKEFEPGSNPFEVTIIRLINPRGVDVRGSDKSILVKLLSRIKMRAFSDAHRRAFENLVKAIDVKEQFCGIFTPDVSEIYFDGDVMIVDLTSYLKPGMEAKIGKLFQVATESPKVHEERIPSRETSDRAITNLFLRNVGTGMAIGDSLRLAIQQQEAGPMDVAPKPVAPPPPLPPPPSPPPPVIQRTTKVEPPTVTVASDQVDTVIDNKIANMERSVKEREVADAKEDAAKSKGKRRSVRLKRRKKGGEEEEGQEPPLAPEMDEPRPETQDVAPAPVEQKPVEPLRVVPPLPQVSKEPEIDIRTAPEGTAEENKQLGSLLSRLKGIDLDAPKDLPKEAPKVSEELKAIPPPPPPKEEPKPEPPPPTKEETKPAPPKEEPKTGIRIPPPPSFGDMDKGDQPAAPKAKEPEKPKSGESGLDDLMKKLRGHSLK